MAERHRKRDALKKRWEKIQEKLHEKVENYQAGLEKNTIANKFMSHLVEEWSSCSKVDALPKLLKDAKYNDVIQEGTSRDLVEKYREETYKDGPGMKSIAEANSTFLKELQAEANTRTKKVMKTPQIHIENYKTTSADNLHELAHFNDEQVQFKGQKVFYINNRLSVSASYLCGNEFISSSSSESNLSCYSSPDHESRVPWPRAGSLPPEASQAPRPNGPADQTLSPADLLQKLGEKFPKLLEQGERLHRYLLRNTRLSDVNKRLKAQIWSSVVTIVLVEAKNLLAMDLDTGSSDPYCKFRLGNEKYKSKVVWKTLHPSWLEQFDLHLYDDQEQVLEVTVWDKDKQTKDDFLGRCTIDLSRLEREKTHSLWRELEEGNGQIFLLLTISGTTQSETITDLTSYQDNPRDKEAVERRYAWYRLNESNSSGVGWLCVKVHGAKGLAAADLGGKSDPFCVLELGNARLQTHTEYKTLAPNWMKIFTFTVKDITSILEITVYDEDHDHKVEFLGKLCVPLLNIKCGEKRWYALKDKKMRARAKGNYPQILLEMLVIWNPVNAAVRALNPKEEKYMQQETKFKRQVFIRNVMRLKSIIMWFIEVGKILQDCFEWESRVMSFFGLMLWLVFCYYFQMWMVPVLLLILLGRNWLIYRLTGGNPLLVPVDDDDLLAEEDDDDPEADKEEKKSLKERLHAIQEVTQTVQNAIGYVASLGEAVKNLMNFTVPYLSYLAILLLFAAGCVLYVIPLRYLLMAWGVNKFTRKILRPHTIPNNEVLDLLSRVPDDELLLDCRELKPHAPGDHRRDGRKKHKAS